METPVGQYQLVGAAAASGVTPAASSTGASCSGVTPAPGTTAHEEEISAPHPKTRGKGAARSAGEAAQAPARPHAPGAAPPPAPPPPPELPEDTVQYGELLVKVPKVFSDHLYPHVDMLLMHQKRSIALAPRYIHNQNVGGGSHSPSVR